MCALVPSAVSLSSHLHPLSALPDRFPACSSHARCSPVTRGRGEEQPPPDTTDEGERTWLLAHGAAPPAAAAYPLSFAHASERARWWPRRLTRRERARCQGALAHAHMASRSGRRERGRSCGPVPVRAAYLFGSRKEPHVGKVEEGRWSWSRASDRRVGVHTVARDDRGGSGRHSAMLLGAVRPCAHTARGRWPPRERGSQSRLAVPRCHL